NNRPVERSRLLFHRIGEAFRVGAGVIQIVTAKSWIFIDADSEDIESAAFVERAFAPMEDRDDLRRLADFVNGCHCDGVLSLREGNGKALRARLEPRAALRQTL